MSIVTPLDILTGASDLVASGWCQNTMARDEGGETVDAWSPDARAWSADGAVLAAWRRSCRNAEELDRSIACFVQANLALAGSIPTTPNRWNNARGRRKEQVVRALTRATALLEWPQPTEAWRPGPRARIRRRLLATGSFDHTEDYDYSEEYEVISVADGGDYVLCDRSGNLAVFDAGGLYADLEVRCEACGTWSSHVAPWNQEEGRWICHGGAFACERA